jgi:hypothetical protein
MSDETPRLVAVRVACKGAYLKTAFPQMPQGGSALLPGRARYEYDTLIFFSHRNSSLLTAVS